MNIEQAKLIHISAILEHWGCTPMKKRNHDVWYLSPLREENTPSFHIDEKRNIWFDFGLGKGGTGIDLVQSWLYSQGKPSSISDVLAWFYQFKATIPSKQTIRPPHLSTKKQPSIYRFLEDKKLSHPKLIEYLKRRAIDIDIASRFVRQAHLWHRKKEKEYYGLSFANDKGGFEFRNPYIKSSFGNKAITTLKGEPNTLQIFEGFMDFLSMLTIYETHKHHSTIIVLNSLSLLPRLLDNLVHFEGTIYTWYDNDKAGKSATEIILHWAKEHPDIQLQTMNHSYDGFKDVNEWLCSYSIPSKKVSIDFK